MTKPRPRTETDLVEFIRSSDLRAPDELHRKVESMIAERLSSPDRRARAPRSRLRFGLGFAGTMAVAAIVAIVVAAGVSGGGTPKLTLHQASALTLSPATLPAPAQSAADSGNLTAAVGDVSFPYWEDRFGWRATGARSDHLDGRSVTTVFYQDRGWRIGYAIFAGTPAPALSGGTVVKNGGVSYRTFNENGTHVITWVRRGHLCVLAGRGVSSTALMKLTSWNDHGAIIT